MKKKQSFEEEAPIEMAMEGINNLLSSVSKMLPTKQGKQLKLKKEYEKLKQQLESLKNEKELKEKIRRLKKEIQDAEESE